MTKMAAMSIYDINPLKTFFPGTSGPISTKLSMKHQTCSNDYPGLTLTFFMARSNLTNLGFYMEKCDNYGLFENYCIL